MPLRVFLGLTLLLLAPGLAGAAAGTPQTVVNLLDYVSVEYPAFVRDGRVLDADEYAEQVEFSSQVRDLIASLPANGQRAALMARAAELSRLVQEKAEAAQVTALARDIQRGVIDAYAVAVTPRQPPNLAAAPTLYAAHCGQCHGTLGDGAGTAAAGLDPAPTDFRDAARASARSVYGLYNTISLGVAGTAMAGFAQLSEEERWALAFHVSAFAADDALRARGAAAWGRGAGRDRFPDLAAVATATPSEARSAGAEAEAILAFLRSQPAAAGAAPGSPIDFSIATLDRSREAWRAGRTDEAYQLAVSAYLEGFELAEAGLAGSDPELTRRTEQAMMAYRNAIQAGAPAQRLETAHAAAIALLHQAKHALSSGNLSPAAGLASSLVIILREGLEAILVLAAMGAFLVKTQRREGLLWLHAGWIAALLVGAVTWVVSSTLIAITGAQREVTEGVTALVSAAVLLYVGFWLHSKSSATRWSAFIRGRMASAVGGFGLKAGLGIALVAFLAVYREVFETVLFYQALWLQASAAGRSAVLIGFAAGAAALVLLAWAIVRFSVRLPLSLFFGVSGAMLAVMAVVFAGQGIAALQEAGKLPVSPLDFPAVPLLGIYPNLQGLLLQLALVTVIVAGWLMMRGPARRA
ncbi:MAG TPA: cytochrome c/FTR1 family iron permease [Burkholderiales bacterium]|jgi:high-affinity iron transporter